MLINATTAYKAEILHLIGVYNIQKSTLTYPNQDIQDSRSKFVRI